MMSRLCIHMIHILVTALAGLLVVATTESFGMSDGRGVYHMPLSDEKRLVSELVKHYTENVTSLGRPKQNSSRPLVITLAMHLIQILNLDEDTQALTTSIKVDYKWRDEYILWMPHDYGGLTSIRLPATDLWVPDMIISNANDKPEIIEDSMLRVHSSGLVVWVHRRVYSTSCQVDMRLYPFDHQTCHLVFRSGGYLPSEIELRWEVPSLGNLLNCDECNVLDEYIEASAWELGEVKYTVDFPGNHINDELVFTIVFRRRIVFFTYLLLLPCVFLTMLTLVNFWLPPERPDKTGLSMSIFGSFMLLLLVLVGAIPSTASTVPILGIYYFFNMVITAVSICLSAFVVNLSRPHRGKKRVPKWLRAITIDTLGGIFGVSAPRSRVLEISKKKKLMKQLSRQQTATSVGTPATDEPQDFPAMPDNYLRIAELQKAGGESSNSQSPNVFRADKECIQILRNITAALLQVRATMGEVKDHLLNKDKVLQVKDDRAWEWHCVAVTLDRLFFFIYFAAIIILTIVSAAILLPARFRAAD